MSASLESTLTQCYNKNCDAKFEKTSKMIIHINEEHQGRVCCRYENCGKVLSSWSIHRHVIEIHKKIMGSEPCTKCGKLIFKYKSTKHSKRCIGAKKTFSCQFDNCKISFAIASDLSKHVDRVHQRPVKCCYQYCDVYVKPSNMAQHLKSVHEKATKTCQYCGKQILFNNIGRHEEFCSSKGKNLLQCTFEGCEKTFTTQNNRSKHNYQVHKSPIKCTRDNCSATVCHGGLARHIRNVHDNIRGKCQFCEQELSATNVKRHEKRCQQRNDDLEWVLNEL